VLQFLQTLPPSALINVPIGQGVQSTLLVVENTKPFEQQAHSLSPFGLTCFLQELQPVPHPAVVKLTLSAAGKHVATSGLQPA
jgi:hypothetical protein